MTKKDEEIEKARDMVSKWVKKQPDRTISKDALIEKLAEALNSQRDSWELMLKHRPIFSDLDLRRYIDNCDQTLSEYQKYKEGKP